MTKAITTCTLCLLILAQWCVAINNAAADTASNDGEIIARKKYSFPPYEQANGVERIYSKEEYERAIGDPNYELEKLTYMSQELKVVAYLYKPKAAMERKRPAIIFNRGSYIRGDIAPELAPLFHRLASEGFIILAPLYRGSDGGEGRDEMGGADMNDLINALSLVKSLPFIDANNLFMYGESRGGMMTFQALRDGFPINAAAVFGAFTDLDNLYKSDPDLYQPLIKTIWPDLTEAGREEILHVRSAVRWPEKINAPLLIMHGGADKSVSPDHALNLAQLLQRLGKKYELVIYGDDNHILSRNREDRDRRTINWFKKHIGN